MTDIREALERIANFESECDDLLDDRSGVGKTVFVETIMEERASDLIGYDTVHDVELCDLIRFFAPIARQALATLSPAPGDVRERLMSLCDLVHDACEAGYPDPRDSERWIHEAGLSALSSASVGAWRPIEAVVGENYLVYYDGWMIANLGEDGIYYCDGWQVTPTKVLPLPPAPEGEA